MNTMKAKICWVLADKGGRKKPPTGPRYSTVARFPEQGGDWSKQAWSIVANFTAPPDEDGCVMAEVGFLSDTAPQHLLKSGATFELMEGPRVVAKAKIL